MNVRRTTRKRRLYGSVPRMQSTINRRNKSADMYSAGCDVIVGRIPRRLAGRGVSPAPAPARDQAVQGVF